MKNDLCHLLCGFAFAIGTLAYVSALSAEENANDESIKIFNERILPIFRSPNPSSCVECHLSGVDLKDYLADSPAETFAALVKQKLVDVEHPEKSKILEFIQRRPDKPNLLSDKIREQEFAAFRDWIVAAAKDKNLLAKVDKVQTVGPEVAVEVIRHGRKDRILRSFEENVWSEIERCASCHSPDRNQKQVEKHGEQVSWITVGSPARTLDYLVGEELIDVDEPAKSMILTKPTMQVEHKGGIKMAIGDRSYKQFLRFLEDYAAIKKGKYVASKDLPEPAAELSKLTDVWLKIENVPEAYDKLLMQVDLYRMTDAGWSKFRVATADRHVFGKGKLWQNNLSLTVPRDSKWAEKLNEQTGLPKGKYLLKIYLDRDAKLLADPTAELGDGELIGELEINSNWPRGYNAMTIVQFPTDK